MKRQTKKSVTCFLRCGDEYLFIHRTNINDKVDAGLLNGIGGKLEPHEDYLTAALRETAEETGYQVAKEDTRLVAVVNLESGYPEDWVMCFFIMDVPSKDIPIGSSNPEGKLIWLHKDEVLNSGYELVDDLNYMWEEMTQTDKVLFAGIEVADNEKISSYTVNRL